MRYLTVVSTALIAATAVPASALPWGFGTRNVEHDALVQRDVADELYTRGLTARSPSKGGNPYPRPGTPNRPQNPIPGAPRPYPGVPHPRPRRPSNTGPRPSGPNPNAPVRPKPHPKPRELDEYLLARAPEDDELWARALEDELYARTFVQRDVADELYTRELTARSPRYNGPRPLSPIRPQHPIPGAPRPYPGVPHPRPRRPSNTGPRPSGPDPNAPVRPRPHPSPRELDEYLLARELEDDELLARAFDDDSELYARMDVDELD